MRGHIRFAFETFRGRIARPGWGSRLWDDRRRSFFARKDPGSASTTHRPKKRSPILTFWCCNPRSRIEGDPIAHAWRPVGQRVTSSSCPGRSRSRSTGQCDGDRAERRQDLARPESRTRRESHGSITISARPSTLGRGRSRASNRSRTSRRARPARWSTSAGLRGTPRDCACAAGFS